MPKVINTSEIHHGPAHYYTFLILAAGITAQPRNNLSWSLPQVLRPCWRRWIITTLWWPLTVQYSGRKSANLTCHKRRVLTDKSCLFLCQASPALPQHHEVQDISADGGGVQGRTASIPAFFWPSRHSTLRNVSSSQIHSTWLGDIVDSSIWLTFSPTSQGLWIWLQYETLSKMSDKSDLFVSHKMRNIFVFRENFDILVRSGCPVCTG